jgi:hypothetical protein
VGAAVQRSVGSEIAGWEMGKGSWEVLDIVNLGVCLRDIAMHIGIDDVIIRTII